jgi:propanol-preferring alcohol dehydrogenase
MMNDLEMPKMSSFGVRSPGHEGAGVVVQCRANVKNFKVGDRAELKPIWDICGTCEHCWDGKETYCKGVQFTGLTVQGLLEFTMYTRHGTDM